MERERVYGRKGKSCAIEHALADAYRDERRRKNCITNRKLSKKRKNITVRILPVKKHTITRTSNCKVDRAIKTYEYFSVIIITGR